MPTSSRPLLRTATWIAAAVLAALLVVALLVLEPWKLLVDETVDEPSPAGRRLSLHPAS